MASNDLSLEGLNLTGQTLDHVLIEKQEFKKLDQIALFKDHLFIADWGEPSGIHILDRKFNHVRFFFDNMWPQGFEIVRIDENEYLGVLTNDGVYFVCFTENEFGLVEHLKLDFELLLRECKMLWQNKKIKAYKGLRCYGLVQDKKDQSLYFIETHLRTIVRFSDLHDSSSFKIYHIRNKLPSSFKAPNLKDLKLYEDIFYLPDHFIPRAEILGNDCIHLFRKNSKLDRFEYIKSIKNVRTPYCIQFIDEKLVVCEREPKGALKVYVKDSDGNFEYDDTINLGCDHPYFFTKVDNQTLVTRASGNQFTYNGSPSLFSYDINF